MALGAATHSSMSCSPVTSGAPSHTTMSARRPEKCATMASAVRLDVMSPWSMCTPAIGAISCKSTATIFAGAGSGAAPSAGAATGAVASPSSGVAAGQASSP